jgi:hypothetical protein
MTMAVKKKRKPAGPLEPPRIHEATLASGHSGAVYKGLEIDLTTAVNRREAGLDVVVCGGDVDANRQVAQMIEAAVGPYKRQNAHDEAGPHALPHFQPSKRPPEGHSFYEAGDIRRKARKAQ